MGISARIVKRIITLLIVILGVVTLSFCLQIFTGTDPAEMLVRKTTLFATEEQIQAMRVELGLDGTLSEQYADYIKGLLTGDLGISITNRKPVIDNIRNALPVTCRMSASQKLGTHIPIMQITLVAWSNALSFHMTENADIKTVKIATRLLTGDLGISITNRKPVIDNIRNALPVTCMLVIMSMLWVAILTVLISAFSVIWKDKAFDHATRLICIMVHVFRVFGWHSFC